MPAKDSILEITDRLF